LTAIYRLLRALLVVSGIACALTTVEASQSANAAELKAAFVFNFAKFAEWPDLAEGPLLLCVLGDDLVRDALTKNVRGQRVNGRNLTVSKISAAAPARSCQILFVGAAEIASSGPLLETIRTAPVLTVSDSPRFAETRGIVELYTEGDRMKFAINLDWAQRSKLRLSSTLLKMARIVRDKDGRGGSRF
jgi:hypothetical protein